jgi:hypothetical protein
MVRTVARLVRDQDDARAVEFALDLDGLNRTTGCMGDRCLDETWRRH